MVRLWDFPYRVECQSSDKQSLPGGGGVLPKTLYTHKKACTQASPCVTKNSCRKGQRLKNVRYEILNSIHYISGALAKIKDEYDAANEDYNATIQEFEEM